MTVGIHRGIQARPGFPTTPRRRFDARGAFTLIEVLIVIAIVAALGALVAFNLIGTREKANTDLAGIDMKTIQRALQLFYTNHNRWPTDAEGIRVLWDKSALENPETDDAKWTRLLDEPSENDPWGSPWQYRAQSEHGDATKYDLWSIGPDKQDGTEDDITSWKKTDGTTDQAGGATGG